MTSKRHSRSFVLALAPDASSSTRLPGLAYLNVPLLTFVEFDTYQNFQGHLAVLPATARLSYNSYCEFLPHAVSRLSVLTFGYRDHIGWNTSKVISRLNSVRYLLRLIVAWAIWSKGNTPKIRVEYDWVAENL